MDILQSFIKLDPSLKLVLDFVKLFYSIVKKLLILIPCSNTLEVIKDN